MIARTTRPAKKIFTIQTLTSAIFLIQGKCAKSFPLPTILYLLKHGSKQHLKEIYIEIKKVNLMFYGVWFFMVYNNSHNSLCNGF